MLLDLKGGDYPASLQALTNHTCNKEETRMWVSYQSSQQELKKLE